MGRKVNPIGFRLPVRRDWKSRWYAKGRHFTELVICDAAARRMIEKDYAAAMISRIEIEQKIGSIRLIIYAARPGVVIGKKGEGIERLRTKLRVIFSAKEVQVDMKEIAQPETDAKVVALTIAGQLENRVMFRRAMRRALANAMRLKVDGIKIMCAGRLNGIEIARTEWYREGRVPLHTLKNDIDYGFAEANTAMGVVGVKVWVSKGDLVGLRKKAKYTYAGGAEAKPAGDGATAAADKPAEVTAAPAAAAAAPVAAAAAAAPEEKKPAVKRVVRRAKAAAATEDKKEDKEEAAAAPAAAAKKAAVKKPAAKKPAAKKTAAPKAATGVKKDAQSKDDDASAS